MKAQEKIGGWVKEVERAARAANEFRDLTVEMQNEFVATYEETKRDFERDLKTKDEEIERLKSSLENDRYAATQMEMINILQSLLDSTKDSEIFYSRVEQLVQFLQDHKGEYVNPTQISLALTFA